MTDLERAALDALGDYWDARDVGEQKLEHARKAMLAAYGRLRVARRKTEDILEKRGEE
jgi:hypothetical protein